MTSELELLPDLDRAPSTLFASPDPAAIVAQATAIANAIAPLIRDQHLVKKIGNSEHVFFEAWTLAGSMLGVFATTIRTWEIGDDTGYGACVEARTMAGALVGRAEAVVMRNEEVGGKRKWLTAPAFQLISMCQTRAGSKALRMPLGFVMKLAGYDATPAEEMEAAAARGETVSGGRGVAAGWRDIGEQDGAHRRMNAHLDEHNLGEFAAVFLDTKGYTLPLSKPQMADLRRALDREVQQQSGAGQSPVAEAGSQRPDPDPTSDPGPVPPGPGSDPASPPPSPGKAGGGDDTSGADGPPTGTPEAEAQPGQLRPGAGSRTAPDHTSAAATEPAAADPSPTSEGSDAIPQAPDKQAGPDGRGGQPGADDPAAWREGAATSGPAPSIEQRSKVLAWCLAQGVNPGMARFQLAKGHPEDFGAGTQHPMRTTNDLMGLRDEAAEMAIKFLTAWKGDTTEEGG